MEPVTQINEKIYRLTTAYKDIFTTVYVIKTEKGAILFDAAIRQAYNASGELPTVKVSVVAAMRAAINEGKI